jgi:dipeptidase E
MRLFLCSYRAQGHEADLVKLFGKGSKVVVINNSKDGKTSEERLQKLNEVLDILKQLEFKPKELDLRDYFKDNSKLKKELSGYSSIWVAGGNTFVLRRAMRYSGCDKLLYDMVRKNEIAYGGDSAGAILATPSLRGSEYGDEPDLIPAGYEEEVIWDGLDFVSYHIVPHYKSDWWGIEAEAMLDYIKQNKLNYRTLMDGQAIIINGDKEEFLE